MAAVSETADVAIVGARCAGSSAAIAFARAGRRAVMLDRGQFPSDTLSTHLLFPGGVAELDRLGALERVRSLGAPPLREALGALAGIELRGPFGAIDGIDYALCVRRPGLDAALVETALEAGAELRERARVVDLIRERGRVAGVRWVDRDGAEHELRAKLVVGADGRRSTVAELVGASAPYRSNANERACFFAYFDDPREEWRGTAAQWRQGRELATAFPCDGGRVLVLLMPPVERVPAFRADLEGELMRTIDSLPAVRERLERCSLASKVRSGIDTTSYFRRSSGAGWALPGDAGHFKDPVTAQGIRDALRFGRLLGERVADRLADTAALDRGLLAWERERERECLPAYQWTNQLARAEAANPIEVELYRWASRRTERVTALNDVFARRRDPDELLRPLRVARLLATALARRGADRRAVVRTGRRELGIAVRDRAERAALATA